MNELQTLMAAHRSVRRFVPTPVPSEAIDRCVRAAQQAATSSHVQAYCLVQIFDAQERERLAELAGGQRQVREAGAFFVVCAEERRHAVVAKRAGEPHERNFESFLVATIDAALFAQNLALAFESEGYGICYIGGVRNDLPAVDALLELPDLVYPLFGLCVGEPAEDPPRRPRLDPAAVWVRERYPSDERVLALVDEQDVRASQWYEQIGKPGRDWSGGLLRKVTRSWRDAARTFYEGKGARLR